MIGRFRYNNEVDPFDGGPHFRCKLKDIKPIRMKTSGFIDTKKFFNEEDALEVLMTIPVKNHP